MLLVYVHIQLTLEQLGFELNGSSYMLIFCNSKCIYYTVQYFHTTVAHGLGLVEHGAGSDAMED